MITIRTTIEDLISACLAISSVYAAQNDIRTKRNLERIIQRLRSFAELPDTAPELRMALSDAWKKIKDLKMELEFEKQNKEMAAVLNNIVSPTTSSSPVIVMSGKNDLNSTKPSRHFKTKHAIEISSTVGNALEHEFDVKKVEMSLAEWQRIVESLNQTPPVIFGRSFGQRLHRCAYHAAINAREKGKNLTATELTEAISERNVEKSKWYDVVNYWLVGMASFRRAELGVTDSNNTELDPKEEIVQARNIMSDTKIEWPKIVSNGRIDLFWATFKLNQRFLHKDWRKDVMRADYRHKPIDQFTKFANPDESSSSAAKVDFDLINRRACKYLLNLCVYNEQPIIYALDGINTTYAAQGAVISIHQGEHSKEKVPVCTTELRELFRNWDHYTSNVLFLEGLKQTKAPWENSADQVYWARYALHLVRKILIEQRFKADFIDTVNKMIKEFKNENYSAVIAEYHKSYPSQYREIMLPISIAKLKQRLQLHEVASMLSKNEDFKEKTQTLIDQIEGIIDASNPNINSTNRRRMRT